MAAKTPIISFKNFSFQYRAQKKPTLQDINLDIYPGERVLIAGPSGSGKSTIAKLIASFWDVRSGSITVGGADIRDISAGHYNKLVAYVSQDNFLFNTSIYDNIKVGKPDATKEEVFAAAQKAQCMEFINRLENGIYTLAGDCGSALSGGERQRVSLARAILKNASVVILDEATANVDPENEWMLQNAIQELTKSKTVIMIAHRLKTVRHADKIIVLDGGTITEQGTHEELVALGGLYAKLYNLQREKYTAKENCAHA